MTEERKKMLEKFCIGLVRILLGGILLFLTMLSAFVTCRVYGGSEIVQYGRDSLFLHLFFGAGVIGLTVFYRRRKERERLVGKEKVRNGGEERKRICRKNQWLLLAAAAYLFWILTPISVWRLRRDFCRAISAPGSRWRIHMGQRKDRLGMRTLIRLRTG